MGFADGGGKSLHRALVQHDAPLALDADQVVPVAGVGDVKILLAAIVGQVGFFDDVVLLQRGDGAVDGGEAEVVALRLQIKVDVLRCQVGGGGEQDVQNRFPLFCHFEPGFFEKFQWVFFHNVPAFPARRPVIGWILNYSMAKWIIMPAATDTR